MTAALQTGPGRHQLDTDADTRGRLEIADKVVEKIASRAAGELSAVGGTSGGFLGIGDRPELSARPKVSVQLSGQVATIDLQVGVRYPAPLRATGDEVRQRVRQRVFELTGIEVRQIDVEISWLVTNKSGNNGRRLE